MKSLPAICCLALVSSFSAAAFDVEPWVEQDVLGLAVSVPIGKAPRQYAQAAPIDPEGGWSVEGSEYIPPGGRRKSAPASMAAAHQTTWYQRAGAWVYRHRWKIGAGVAVVGAVKVWEHNDWWPFDGGGSSSSSSSTTSSSTSSETTEDNSARTYVNGPQQHVTLDVSGDNNQVNVTVNNTPQAETEGVE